ncbi:Leucine-rich repeat domain superfamily [Sesbania bispinosa]|nr:Leucine-rich repeat domain superfamily [Sesbania bispinosa]
MADRISGLPDPILCHILSFLPTKLTVATSVLSKRWKPLWRSVPSFDFQDISYVPDYHKNEDMKNFSHFVQSVYAYIFSRDLHQPIQRFHLYCTSLILCDPTNVCIWVNVAVQRRVEHLELYFFWPSSSPQIRALGTNLFPIISCRTLVVLKLKGLTVEAPLSVHLPSLKILHLGIIVFLERGYFLEFLSGCPILEDLKTHVLTFRNYLTKGEFNSLPKLVRADISRHHIPLEAVNNVEYLRIDWMDMVNEKYTICCYKDFIPIFHNLTHIDLTYVNYIKDWLEVVEVLNSCPKLQVLVIKMLSYFFLDEKEEGGDWPYPRSVPKCFLLHLKKCYLKGYKGMKGEFRLQDISCRMLDFYRA